jgi:hypothetical protein
MSIMLIGTMHCVTLVIKKCKKYHSREHCPCVNVLNNAFHQRLPTHGECLLYGAVGAGTVQGLTMYFCAGKGLVYLATGVCIGVAAPTACIVIVGGLVGAVVGGFILK